MPQKSIKIDKERLLLICDTNVKWGDILDALENTGFQPGIYPQASSDITIGSWLDNGIPSNIGSYKYGCITEQVRSMRSCLTDGEVIESGFDSVSGFSTGYNLNALLVGSNGTLAETKSVTLRLYPKMPVLKPLYFQFTSVKGLTESLRTISKNPIAPYNVSFLLVLKNKNAVEISLNIALEGTDELISAHEKIIDAFIDGATKSDIATASEMWKNRFLDRSLSKLDETEFLGDWPIPLSSAFDFIEDLSGIGDFDTLYVSGLLADRSTVVFSIAVPQNTGTKVDFNIIEDKLVSICELRNGYSLKWSKSEDNLDTFKSKMAKFHSPGGLEFIAAIKITFDRNNNLGANDCIISYIKETDISKIELRPQGILGRIEKGFTPEMKKELTLLLGEPKVSCEDFEVILYNHDLAPLPHEIETIFHRIPGAVVRPSTTEDIIKVIKFAKRYGLPIIPRGGASWGFGGAVPTQGGVVIDFTSMNRIIDIDETHLVVTCQPGVTWEQVITDVEKRGLSIGAYPGSFPVATIGGWLSTGGSGIASYKYGTSFDQVRSLQVILSDGSVLNTGPKLISATGYYNFNSIFVGAEGTTGIITEVTLKLHPKMDDTRPLSYSFKEMTSLGDALLEITQSPVLPYHISFLDGNHFRYLEMLGHESEHSEIPSDGGVVNIVLEGFAAENDWAEGEVNSIMKKHSGVKESIEFASHEWGERAYELRARRLGPGGVLGEVVVPIGKFNDMVHEARNIIKELRMESSINGVIVDRNTVVFMPYFISDERNMLKSLSSMGYVKRLIDAGSSLGGRPSGLGIWFVGNLKKLHGARGAQLIRDLKIAFDPDDILNPGKYTEIRTRYGIAVPPFLMDVMLKVMGMIKSRLPRDELNIPPGEPPN